MKHTNYSLALGTSLLLSATTQAAIFTIGGGTFSPIQESTGTTNLQTNSIVQVGYFLGVNAATDPSVYTPAQWNSFTAISGIDSLNSAKISEINDALGPGTFDLAVAYDTAIDNLPASYAVRLGIRIFDNTSSTVGAEFNTVSASSSNWVLNDPTTPTPPTPPSLTLFDSPISWEGGSGSAYKTTLTAVPEPSSFALLGLGAAAMIFRRKK